MTSIGVTATGKHVPPTEVPRDWSEDEYADAAELHYQQGKEHDKLARKFPTKDHGTQAEFHYKMARTLLKHAGLSESHSPKARLEEAMTLINNPPQIPLRKSAGWRANRAIDTTRTRNAELNHSIKQSVGELPDTQRTTNVQEMPDDTTHNLLPQVGSDPNAEHQPQTAPISRDDMLRVGESGTHGLDPTKKFHVVDWDRFGRGGMNRTAMRNHGIARYAVLDTTALPITHVSMAMTRKKVLHSTDTREQAEKIAADLNAEFHSAKGTHEEKAKPKFGLAHAPRDYKCLDCGGTKKITTNHTDDVSDHCPSCSWKGIGFGKTGHYLGGGPPMRRFTFVGKNESVSEATNLLRDYNQGRAALEAHGWKRSSPDGRWSHPKQKGSIQFNGAGWGHTNINAARQGMGGAELAAHLDKLHKSKARIVATGIAGIPAQESHTLPPNPKPALPGAGGQDKSKEKDAQGNYVHQLALRNFPTPNKKAMPHLERLRVLTEKLTDTMAQKEVDETARNSRVIGTTSSGKVVYHHAHDLYTERQRFPKYNGPVSPLFNGGSARRSMMRMRFPDWTQQDHLEAAALHDAEAAKGRGKLKGKYDRASTHQIGPARYSGPDNSIIHGSDYDYQPKSYSGSNLAGRNLSSAKADISGHTAAAEAHRAASLYIRTKH